MSSFIESPLNFDFFLLKIVFSKVIFPSKAGILSKEGPLRKFYRPLTFVRRVCLLVSSGAFKFWTSQKGFFPAPVPNIPYMLSSSPRRSSSRPFVSVLPKTNTWLCSLGFYSSFPAFAAVQLSALISHRFSLKYQTGYSWHPWLGPFIWLKGLGLVKVSLLPDVWKIQI